ncbi:MAG: hypothetical protein Fur0032_18970 [Terrimicrobiaceae bacterium]
MVPPPMAKPETIRVERGSSVEIPLKAGGRTPGPIQFIIRQAPRHGALGEPRLVKPNEAVILYEHDARSGAEVDVLRYAAQAADSPVGAAAEVKILITEPPVRPVFPESLDFGEIVAGSSGDCDLLVSNVRGGAGSMHLEVPPPWVAEGGKTVAVPAGGTVRIRLGFRPSTGGRFEDFLRLRWADQAGAVKLTGMALDLIRVVMVDGGIRVESRSEEPIKVEVEAPTGLDIPASLTVPAAGHVLIPLQRQEGHLAEVRGSVVFLADGVRKSVPVRIEALPARLEIDPAAGLDFGRVGAGSPARAQMSVHNAGGQPGSFQVESEGGLRVLPPPDQIMIAPGDTQEFVVEFLSAESGLARGRLRLVGPGGRVITEIPWKAVVSATAVSTTPAPESSPAQIVESAEPPPSPSATPLPTLPPRPPQIEGVRVTQSSTNRMQVAWQEPKPRPDRYLVERREIVFVSENEPPLEKWIPWDGIVLNREGDTARATFVRLPANASWFVRVQALDRDGNLIASTGTFRIFSQPRASNAVVVWLTLGAAVTLAVILWRWKQRRQKQFSPEAAGSAS